jgi:hypothetical protein
VSACLPLTREAPSRELLPYTFTAKDTTDAPVMGADVERRSLLIVNTSTTDSVWIVKGRGAAINDFSYELKPGEGATFGTAGPLYMRCQTGKSVVVKTLAENGAV